MPINVNHSFFLCFRFKGVRYCLLFLIEAFRLRPTLGRILIVLYRLCMVITCVNYERFCRDSKANCSARIPPVYVSHKRDFKRTFIIRLSRRTIHTFFRRINGFGIREDGPTSIPSRAFTIRPRSDLMVGDSRI